MKRWMRGAVQQIREDMERAEARRLQPHFIAAFFREAFALLGGSMHEREPKRYEITHVPATIRNRDRIIGTGDPVLSRYERITFERHLITLPGKALAEFVCPGHPLLDATVDLVLERYRDLLKRGAMLVDENSASESVRALAYLEHSIQDARLGVGRDRHVVSRQMQFVELEEDGQVRQAGYAPYLDYRPITDEERLLVAERLASDWLSADLETRATAYAVAELVPQHFAEVKARKETLIDKTMAAVKDRLTKEINYWDHRAEELKAQELAGKTPRLNSGKARQRADELEARLRKRMEELEQERRLSPLPPVVIGGALIVPKVLLDLLRGVPRAADQVSVADRARIDRLAMEAVLAAERRLGREPRAMPHENPGYDIESRDVANNRLLFIEVKGKAAGLPTITISKTQIMTALNKRDDSFSPSSKSTARRRVSHAIFAIHSSVSRTSG